MFMDHGKLPRQWQRRRLESKGAPVVLRALAKSREVAQTLAANGNILRLLRAGRGAGVVPRRLPSRPLLRDKRRRTRGAHHPLRNHPPRRGRDVRGGRLFGNRRKDGFQVMNWNKPRKLWQWLLLLMPAVAAIAASDMAKWWMPPIPPLRYPNGLV